MICLSKLRKTGFGQATISLLFAAGLAASDKVPAAGNILDRYVSVTGGNSNWHSRKFERDEVEGRALDDNRVVLQATIFTSRSGDSLSEVHIPQEATEGVYQGTAWALSAFSGVRIKHGAEKAEAVRDSRMLEEADWRTLYPKARLAGIEEADAKRCYKVALTADKTEWFEVATGLLVRRESSELSTSGSTSVGYTVERWASRDGLMQPSVMLAWRGEFHYRLIVVNSTYNNAKPLQYPREVAEYMAGKALPNAEELIERHIYATGGVEAYGNLKTQQVTGALTFLSSNMQAHVETWAAEGGKYYQSVELPGLGKQEEGSDGSVTWERSPTLGPRVKLRAGRDGLGVTLDAAQVIGWRYQIAQVRTEAEETIEGHECYRVRLVPRGGSQPLIRWYDSRTGLLYRTSIPIATDMGTLPVTMTFEEYKDTAGLKWPARIRMITSGQDLLFTTSEVKLNEPVEKTVFDLPAEIQLLAQKKAAETL